MIEQGVLPHSDLYHTGIVVDDLASAVDEFGALLGVTWLEGGAEVRMLTDAGPRTVTTAYALSSEGPHHVELVQSIEGTLWTVGDSARAHHLGYWADDVVATSAALATRGYPRVASISFGDDDAPPICAYHQASDGFYVEIVSPTLRPLLFRTKS